MNKLVLVRSIFGDKSAELWDKCFSPRVTSITGEIEFDIINFEEFLKTDYGYEGDISLKEFCDNKFGEGKIEKLLGI